MAKRIVFCADGTWDTPGKTTNVYKLYKALSTTSEQVPYYDDGVGSDGCFIQKLTGGAFGFGLYQKIKDGYTKLAHAYEKDDEIYIFGFSRGAYTARSLAGMISVCGLPTENFSDAMVETAFNAYRSKDHREALLAELKSSCGMYDAKITMIGVWDTVGSLGIPAAFGSVSPLIYGFLDNSLHADVLHAYHALALDERREQFPATLWTSQPAPGQTIEQVWFSGVHCDVGGSYPDDSDGSALSDLTLTWMVDKAARLGLAFDPAFRQKYTLPANPALALDSKHESWEVLWGLPRRRSIDDHSVLADTVFLRCQHDQTYRPANLTITDGMPASTYRVARIVSAGAAAAGG
jgi:uncharacterized protein (DUF2235 family)